MPPVTSQHAYVKGIKGDFLRRASSLLSENQFKAVSDSNTIALPVSKVMEGFPFSLDYKIMNGTTYLRIGFGIHNLSYQLCPLVEVLEKTGTLE